MNHLYLKNQIIFKHAFYCVYYSAVKYPTLSLFVSLLVRLMAAELSVQLSVFCFITESCETILSCHVTLESVFKGRADRMQKRGKDER